MTDMIVGRYAGLITFTLNKTGDWSRELAIYNSTLKKSEVFSAKGDLGSLVWCTKDGKGYILGNVTQEGGSTSNHVMYCTPGYFLLEQIKKVYPHADFYRKTW